MPTFRSVGRAVQSGGRYRRSAVQALAGRSEASIPYKDSFMQIYTVLNTGLVSEISLFDAVLYFLNNLIINQFIN
jgi:hypothetical protein